MATTTNFGWETPDDTDLVKDGAAAIRTLGSSIDTTMATMVAKTIVDAKGDLIAATAADTVSRLAIGTNDQVLTADSTAATGMKWASPSGSYTLISTTNLSTATVTLSSIPQTYQNLVLVFRDIAPSASDNLRIRINSVTSSVYSVLQPSNGAGIACDQTHLRSTIQISSSATDAFLQYQFYNYAQTVAFKSVMYNATFLNAGTASIQTQLAHAGIASTEAISSIELTFTSGSTFSAGQALLYGVK